MAESTAINEEDDHFFDASDDFPFHDCTDTFQLEPSTSDSTLSHPEPIKDEPFNSLNPQNPPDYSFSNSLRCRKSLSKHSRHQTSGEDPNIFPVRSGTSRIHDTATSRAKIYKIHRNLKETEREFKNSESTQGQTGSARDPSIISGVATENSTITTVINDQVDDSAAELDDSSSNFLVYLAVLLIKAIGFQVKVIISFFTFPIWSLYCSYMFLIDPFRTIRHGREYFMGKMFKVWSIVCESISPFIYEWLKEQKSIWKLVLQFGWGFLWAAYVCFVLCGLLMLSFITSGLVIRYMVKEPIQIKETLNFDYTKNSPVAFVPIISCPDVSCGVHCREKIDVGKSMASRLIPPNHKLQVTVSLTLPESDYNRNLGNFQVRVDFLTANGNTIASLRHLCMLQFKSQPIRLLLTFLKTAPLLTGYLSESQTLNVKLSGFTEGHVPTSCLKVVVEQRAEFRPGAGIPEIYAASLFLESELPLFKRLMWYWKKTLFIWISMIFFMMELLFALLCCRPLIIPRVRTRDSSSANNIPQNGQPVQRS